MNSLSGVLPEAFLETLKAQVVEAANELTDEPSTSPAPVAFAQEGYVKVVLDALEDLGQIGGAELCHFEQKVGRGLGRVVGYYPEEDEGRLDLFTTVWNGLLGLPRVGKADILKAIRQALAVFDAAERGWHEQMEPANAAFDMMSHIHVSARSFTRIRVLVFVDGLAAPVGDLPDELAERGVVVDVWDTQRLGRAVASGLPYEPIEIDFVERVGRALPCLSVPLNKADYKACLTALPGDLLHSLYHEFGSRLLELNVRSFLQARGKVNRGIRETLRSEPSRFLAYNNGISATAEEIDYVALEDGGLGIRRLKGLQIVNGGQTVASIHRARENDRADLSDTFVQAKITIVEPESLEALVPLVSRYANTQNRVNEADFSANHPFHVRLQQLSERTWAPGEATRWFYERARGQYQVARTREGATPARARQFDVRTPTRQRFNKVDLARYLNTWEELPHTVSRGGQKNFVAFMERLARRHGPAFEPDPQFFKRLISCAIIFKATEKIARKQKIPAYRANAIAYTVSLLAYRTAGRVDLERVWEEQDVSSALSQTLEEWLPQVHAALIESSRGRNVTEWCKKEDCWRNIQTLPLSVPRDLEEELAQGQALPTVGDVGGKKGDSLTPQDRENLARVMQVSGEEWLQVSSWGSKSGVLKEWEYGIAATLATYAAQAWAKVPSAKQAKHGVRILQLADESGVRLRDE